MSRIASYLASLQGRKALIPFITAGDPHPDHTVALMHGLVEGGADIIELGIPFSDPMADGPVIQRSSERALAHGVTLRRVLGMAATFRRHNVRTPVVLMGYLNPVFSMGYGRFARAAKEAGIDGLLAVDCPTEEAPELSQALNEHGIDPIFLLAPTTPWERVECIASHARGYLYYVSLKGVTGAGHLDIQAVTTHLGELRRRVALPIGIGFGIQDGEAARRLAPLADAIIVGSRLIEELENSALPETAARLEALTREFKAAVLSASHG